MRADVEPLHGVHEGLLPQVGRPIVSEADIAALGHLADQQILVTLRRHRESFSRAQAVGRSNFEAEYKIDSNCDWTIAVWKLRVSLPRYRSFCQVIV